MKDVTDLLAPGESAVVVFTRGQHLTPGRDGTSGNWVMDPKRRADWFIVYCRDGRAGEPAQIGRARYVDASPSPEPGRFLVEFRGMEQVGTTRLSWSEFALTRTNPVRHIECGR
jgi:hypothetical protein